MLLLLMLASTLAAKDPGVFDDYFGDELRYVDIPQDFVLKSCMSGDETAKKVGSAYNSCFGKDYNFDDLASNLNGADSDNDDLPDEYEGNEACFYKAMGWVKNGQVDAAAIKADMAGLEEGVRTQFEVNIDSCAAWSGSFSSRRRRGAVEEESKKVPSLVEAGSRTMGWIRSLVRRSAEPAKEGGGEGGQKEGKKGTKKPKGKTTDKGNGGNGKGGKEKGGKTGTRKGKGSKRDEGKGGKVRGGNTGTRKGKGSKRGEGKGGKGRGGNKGTRKGKGSITEEGKGGKGRGGNKGTRKGKGNKTDEGKGGKAKGGKGNGGNEKGDTGKGGKAGTRKSADLLDEAAYNQLWCFDLAMEQALEKCVEDKIKN